ncbi:MAG: NifB/NifX family molybdenum-iron cluster-binding protein [Draconibacterium sp.]
MKITFAFAVNNQGLFENNHFGEAENFAIFTSSENELQHLETLSNPVKNKHMEGEHGLKDKALQIISVLKEKEVNVLVSKQFGKNINIVNQHFIPVIIHEENLEQVTMILGRNINWLKDELKNRDSDYMLFRIKTGILKSSVNK